MYKKMKMKQKRLFSSMLAFLLVIAMVLPSAQVTHAAEPETTVIRAGSAEELPDEIPEGTTVELTADIDLNDLEDYWCIWNIDGVLDGKGHTITLKDSVLADEVSGIVRNLGLNGVCDGSSSVAFTLTGTIQNCYSVADLRPGYGAGGLVYYIDGGIIQNSYFAGINPSDAAGIAYDARGSEAVLKNTYYLNTDENGNEIPCIKQKYDAVVEEYVSGHSEAEMRSKEFADLLNKDIDEVGFSFTLPEDDSVNGGYPILTEASEKPEEPEPEPITPNLKNLWVTGGTMEPEFNDGTNYDVYVEEGTEFITVGAETVNSKATVSMTLEQETYDLGDEIPVMDGKSIRVTGTISYSMGSSGRSYFLTFRVVKAAEDGYGFTVSDADGELKIREEGVHSDGTQYLRVSVPEGTEIVNIFRERQIELTDKGGSVIAAEGLGKVELETAPYTGKENYFKVLSGDKTYDVYFETADRIEIDESLPSVEITEDDLNGNAYDTYYYTEGFNYYYNGEYVVFTDNEHFTVDEETYELKNQKTEVTVENENDGNVTVSLSNLTTPVGGISGAWNSSYGGEVQVVYQTDIPGMEEVRTAKLADAISLSDVPDGTWHLTGGKIFEKANSYSPGYDFGDGQGTVKENYFCTLPDITFEVKRPVEVEEGYIGTPTYAEVYDDFENDLWLQYQQKELKVGETADLYPWRMYQIITDTINNDVFRPEFHFEIISGSSISLDKTASNDKAVVTAVKPGTSIVKVTYDAADYKGQHWDAVSDVNIAYAVFTVGENGKATIRTNAEFANWRHYDTIYYTEGETVPYEFTVDTENAASVRVKVNGIEIEGDGNKYTAPLENRSNIIGIEAVDEDGNVTSMYRIIDARFIEINAANKTNPEEALKAGDTATVSFRGITMPVYKLATIYNPQFGGGTWVSYSNEKLGEFKGKCSQWDLATRNSFDVTFAEEGTYDFHSEKGIRCAWWGDDLGSDKVKQGQGAPNLNANSIEDFFSVLPDFTITVGESEEPTDPTDPTDPEEPTDPSEPTEGGTVTFTVERFTIGQGFYQKPVQLKFEAGQTAMEVLDQYLGDKGVYNADKTYLGGIKGADLGLQGVTVPAYIKELLGGPDTEEAVAYGNGNDDVLGEFDYAAGSGWMYSVNGEFPGVGMADYELKDGDVFRVQFTLMWGMDLSDKSFDGTEGAPVSEKEEAMKLLAEFTGMENFEELMKDQAINKAFHDLYKKVQNAIEPQESIDAAVKALQDALKGIPTDPEEPDPEKPDPEKPDPEKPEPKPPVTDEDKDKDKDKEITLTYKNYPISVTGKNLDQYELVLKALTANDADVKKMQQVTPSNCSLIRLYDVKLLKNGEEVQPESAVKVNFNVGSKYNGKTLTVLHVVDGKIEKLNGKVEDGILSVSVDHFSKFGVIVTTASAGNNTADDTDTSVKGNGSGSSGNGSGSSGSGSVKTGDETPLMFYTALLCAAFAVGAAVLYRKRKYHEK